MSAKEIKLVLGASPRVRLLPPEVADRKRFAAVRRSVVFSVVGALVLCAGAYSFAGWQAIEAGAKYDNAQLETSELLKQQSEFIEVRTLSGQVTSIEDAQRVATLTEVDWKTFYERIVPTLPADMTIKSFNVDSGSPITSLSQETETGTYSAAAETVFVAVSPRFESAQEWVVALKNLPEFDGAMATVVTRDEAGLYTVTVALRLSEVARTGRFAPAPAETEVPVETTLVEEGSN
jgi:hypothetical protein